MVPRNGTSPECSPGTPAQHHPRPHAVTLSLSLPILQPYSACFPVPSSLLASSSTSCAVAFQVLVLQQGSVPSVLLHDAATRRTEPLPGLPPPPSLPFVPLSLFFFIFPSKPPQVPSSIPPQIILFPCNATAMLKLPLPHPSLLRRLSPFGSASGL